MEGALVREIGSLKEADRHCETISSTGMRDA